VLKSIRHFKGLNIVVGIFILSGPILWAAPEKAPQTYVIVHGATSGGWDWKNVDRLLSAEGNTVYRPTLTGLGERIHLANAEINLTTHVTDIVNVILFEDLHNVILVGHSYGGMVIAGVMDRVPDRIRHVVFLDAFAPEDGQNALEYSHQKLSDFKVVGGMIMFGWLNPAQPYPRAAPQPVKTYTEPVSYRNPAAKLLPVTYIWFDHPDYSRGDRSREESEVQRLHRERGWTIRTLESDHNAQRSHPKELVAMLEDALNDRNTAVVDAPGH
jgi:pimeloyl-ACP methyl ester carboxylesterase